MLPVVLAYFSLYVVWGSTYFFIKWSVETIPPYFVVGFRFFTGGLLLLSMGALFGRFKRTPTFREVLVSFFLGALLLAGGNGLVTVAERKVDSYLAALVIAATPIFVAVFDFLLFRKKVLFFQLVGILAGVAGVGLILYNGQSFRSSLSPEILLVILAMTSWSLATSLGHKLKPYPEPLVNSGLQMLFIGTICLAIYLVADPGIFSRMGDFSARSWWGMGYLAVFGSTLGFGAFTYLISREPAIRVVSYALVNPLIAVFLGLGTGEKAGPFLFWGMPLVLVGVAVMLYGETLWVRLTGKSRA